MIKDGDWTCDLIDSGNSWVQVGADLFRELSIERVTQLLGIRGQNCTLVFLASSLALHPVRQTGPQVK